MRIEKHKETLKEVSEEIELALKDERGLVSHQRRIAFSVSLGITEIIELYFHKLNVLKEGSKINHLWFRRKKERVMDKLQNQIVSPINSIDGIEEIIDIAKEIEEKRDDLVYGAPANEEILQKKINLFLKLRKVTKC